MNNIDYIHNQDYQLRDNILLECSQDKAINSNYVYDWTCDIGEVNIKMGDEIMIYQSFLNVKGASNETINILDEEVNGNNPAKTPIEIQYYKCNDGLNSLPMPYAFQLLSQGTEEADIDNINGGFYSHQSTGEASCIGSGMYVGTDCERNIIGSGTSLMLLADLLRPIDCSRYTLMEQYIDEDAEYAKEPRIKHKIHTGTHIINLESDYYTPSNLCDNITKSITNPTLNNTIDEFDKEIGIDITTPTMIKHKGLYRSRLNYGGIVTASAISGTEHDYNYYNLWHSGSYLGKSLWGWDIVNTRRTNDAYHTTWYFGGTTEADIKNGFPAISDDYFRPAPSWDFYGGTDRFEIGTAYKSASPITDGNLSRHLKYYYKYPQTVIAGEKCWNSVVPNSFTRGLTGTLTTALEYNSINITKFHNLVNTALEEGVYDDIKVRKFYNSSGGTSQITLNKETQRALCIARVNGDDALVGTATDNYYYGFPTNKYGYNYGCDLGGIGSSTASYTGVNAYQLMTSVHGTEESKFNHSVQNTLGSYVSNIQLIKYDKDNIDGSGICVNDGGYLGFVVGTDEGGFIQSRGGTSKIGWFPKHSDGLFNSAICHINPHGLGYKPHDRRIVGKLTGGTFTTQIQPLVLSGGDHPVFAPSEITFGTTTANAKSWNSSNPNVYCGAIQPKFNFDTDLSRFTISDLYTPEYISNSVYATSGNPNTDAGSSVVYLNPIFQETHNQFIDKWQNWNITGTGLFKPLGHRTYMMNADRNRNTLKKGVAIMDANMGIYISKWADNDSEEAWNSTLWSKIGFSRETLYPPNNRHYRNEDYTIGTTITLSNPSTTNANFDVSLMNQFATNLYDYPIYEIGASGEVLQREISAPSSEIVADKLPIKNELPYYIICSDILSYGGMNEYRQGGNTLPAIDICSLNYNSEDYYFAEPSQLTHIADKDLNIHSVNIVVRRPDGKLATELSGKSSVIIKISRNTTLPAIQINEDVGENLQQLNKNTEKLPPQISGGVLGASGGTLMGGKITANEVAKFRALTNLGIMGDTMEELQGVEPQLYNEMVEQSRENQANDMNVYEEWRRIQQQNIILEAQIQSNRQTLRDYNLEIQRVSEETQMRQNIFGEGSELERDVYRITNYQEGLAEIEADRERIRRYNEGLIRILDDRQYQENMLMNDIPTAPPTLPPPNLGFTPNLSNITLYEQINNEIRQRNNINNELLNVRSDLMDYIFDENIGIDEYPNLPFDNIVETDNNNNNDNLLNDIDEEEDDEYDPTLEPTQSNVTDPELTKEEGEKEQLGVLEEDLEYEKQQREKEQKEKDKADRERFTPKKELKRTDTGTTGETKSSVFTTPSQLDEQQRKREEEKKEEGEQKVAYGRGRDD